MQILFWNVENLFNPETGGPRMDYTPEYGWTQERLEGKVSRLAEIINIIDTEKKKTNKRDNSSVTADESAAEKDDRVVLCGLCEVENPEIVSKISSSLRPGLKTVFPEKFFSAQIMSQPLSDQNEDISYADTGLIYDSEILTLKRAFWHSVMPQFRKGDILEAVFTVKSSEEGEPLVLEKSFSQARELTVFVCHFKARGGDNSFTGTYRGFQNAYLQQLIWKMHSGEKAYLDKRLRGKEFTGHCMDKNIIIMGDFNDDPYSDSMIRYLKATHDRACVENQKNLMGIFLYNMAFSALTCDPCGTNYYENDKVSPWSLLDQIVISPSLLAGEQGLSVDPCSFRIISDLTDDGNGIPDRICGWDEEDNMYWNDSGYSDHFPIAADLCVNK